MCPHCLAMMFVAGLSSIPLIKPTARVLKSKFTRQEAMKENFGILYGKKKDHAA